MTFLLPPALLPSFTLPPKPMKRVFLSLLLSLLLAGFGWLGYYFWKQAHTR